jgi:hypothetical protein
MLEEPGVGMPASADDLKRILVALTRPHLNIWTAAISQPNPGEMRDL